uniref:Uncharacterized protein n=1 Tax=Mesocestoides corti TaxID=53468 RepID=A0A5K3EN04_MESCO
MDDESFLQVYKNKVPRQLFACATNQPDAGCRKCRIGYFTTHEQCNEPRQNLRTASLLRLGYSTQRRLRAQTYRTRPASANPPSLCIPIPCEDDVQPTTYRHTYEAVYNERCRKRGGLEWTASVCGFGF